MRQCRTILIAAISAAWLGASVAHAATIVVEGAGNPTPIPSGDGGLPASGYTYDFGAVPTGETRSATISVSYLFDDGESFRGSDFDFYASTAAMALIPGTGAGPLIPDALPNVYSFACGGGGCSMSVTFSPAAQGPDFGFLALSLSVAGLENVYFVSALVNFPGNGIAPDGGDSPAAVPAPATLPLIASGIGALGLARWRRKRAGVP